MKIAVTGGTGFIGRHVIDKLLLDGHTVCALTRNKQDSARDGLNWIIGDLSSSKEDLVRFLDGVEVVCHCAGEIRDEQLFMEINYKATVNLALAAIAANVKRFIHLSSTGVYGNRCAGLLNETTKMQGMNAYEASKMCADSWLLENDLKQLSLVLIRPAIVFGTDMPNQSLRQWVNVIKKQHYFFIGDPGASANYIHIDKLSNAISTLTQSVLLNTKNVYNISDWLTVEDFVSEICLAANVKYPKVRLPLWFARFLAYCSETVSWLINRAPLLTNARIDVLISKVRYDSTKYKQEIGEFNHITLKQDIHKVVKHWDRQ